MHPAALTSQSSPCIPNRAKSLLFNSSLAEHKRCASKVYKRWHYGVQHPWSVDCLFLPSKSCHTPRFQQQAPYSEQGRWYSSQGNLIIAWPGLHYWPALGVPCSLAMWCVYVCVCRCACAGSQPTITQYSGCAIMQLDHWSSGGGTARLPQGQDPAVLAVCCPVAQ